MLGYVRDNWVELANALGAWTAGCAHIYAAIHVSAHLRRLFIVIAAMAWLYSIAYWVLFFELVSVRDWSDFLRPLGVITWGVAWAIEPIVFVYYMRRRGEGLIRQAETLTKELGEVIDDG